ncbi:MAG: hypothetical protein IT204_24860 [Fimbriimonadaceae bacterium]|nr:hypothetical protein [Fimbriimonadaceae bacterium]
MAERATPPAPPEVVKNAAAWELEPYEEVDSGGDQPVAPPDLAPGPVSAAELERWLGVDPGDQRTALSCALNRGNLKLLFAVGLILLLMSGNTVSHAVRESDSMGVWDLLWIAVPVLPAVALAALLYFVMGWPVRLVASARGLHVARGCCSQHLRWCDLHGLKVDSAAGHTWYTIKAGPQSVRVYNESGSVRRIAETVQRLTAAKNEGREVPAELL